MVGFLRFLKRKRHSGRHSSEEPFKNRSDSASTTLDDSTEHEEAPWRATAVLDHTPIQEKDWWTTNLTCTTVDPEVATNDNSNKNNNQVATQDSVEMHFHNRGEEVWEHCRNEWRNYQGSPSLSSSPSPRKPTKPLGNMQRRAVLAGLSRQREYNLPRRIRLEELVGVYQDIWHQDSE